MKLHRHSGALPDDLAPLFVHGGGSPRHEKIDFSAGINPLGLPDSVLFALRAHVGVATQYPDPSCAKLRAILAKLHDVPPENILIGNGTSELIDLIARVIPPRGAAIVEPTYTEYLRAYLLAGGEADHWLPSSPKLRPDPFDPGPERAVWLGNPNNPTGFLWPNADLRAWIEALPDVLFVVDEAFLPFRSDDSLNSLVPLASEIDNLIVLRSLTKFLVIPGLRLGYAVAARRRIELLRGHQPPWSVNALAQLAGEVGVVDKEFAERSRSWCEEERRWLFEELSRLSDRLTVFEPSANFVLLKLRQGNARVLAARLAEQGIRIRIADNFVGLDQRFFRVGLRTRTDNERLVRALRGYE